MRTCAPLTCVAVVLALAGCGGGSGGGDPTAAIQQAVKSSPLSYFHYAGSAWWGRPVKVHLTILRYSSEQATAMVAVTSGGKTLANQTVLLVKTGDAWKISGAEAATQDEANFGTVSGTVAKRPPTAAERAAVTAGALRSFPGESDCLRFDISMSKVDPAWASAVIRFVGPNRITCATTGTPVLHRGANGWRMVAVETGELSCTKAPPGVVRSLFGSCRIAG